MTPFYERLPVSFQVLRFSHFSLLLKNVSQYKIGDEE